MAPRTPCFPEPASPFQSARDGRWTSRRPGGLKGRAALGPSRTTQAEREPAAPSGSRRTAPTTARDRRSLGPLARHGRARTPQADGRGAWFERRAASFVSAGNRRFPACGQNPQDSGNITRELRSLERQRVPERSSAARAFEGVRFVAERFGTNHPYHTHARSNRWFTTPSDWKNSSERFSGPLVPR